MTQEEILAAVAERNRITGVLLPAEHPAVAYAMWQLWLGQWLERNTDYLRHHPDCNAAVLNSKECNCGVRELVRSIKSKGSWIPGMDYE